MLRAAIPLFIKKIWGSTPDGATIREIPDNSQVGINDGWASFETGFPVLNGVQDNAGGVPPFQQDFNGILRRITAWLQWGQAGGPIGYDSAFAVAIGGYPAGATLASSVAGSYWISTADGNLTNPEGASPSGWTLVPAASLASFINSSGLTPDKADTTQFTRAVRSQSLNWLAAGGTANAITLTPDPAFTSFTQLIGVPLRFLSSAANTGTVTINVNGRGTKPLTWPDGSPYGAGEIPGPGTLMQAIYDGTAFRGGVVSPSPRQVLALTSWASRKAVYTGAGSYTYTVPSANRADRLTDIEVELQAAGGAGGASGDGSSGGIAGNIGAGGGGGAFAKKKITGLTPGSTIPITLGAPGVGATGAAGTDASNASFGAYFTLGGGKGGAFGSATRAIGGAGGALVSGSVDELCIGASGGFSGPNSATVTASDVITGYGRGGLSHEGFVPLNETGAAGIGYGSGGTGASGGSGLKGGDGAPPKCIIRA